MNSMIQFLTAALPWLAMGVLLAMFFARNADRKKNAKQQADYGSLGMSMGMCFGLAIELSWTHHIGIGMAIGMLLGLVIGSEIKKEDETGKAIAEIQEDAEWSYTSQNDEEGEQK